MKEEKLDPITPGEVLLEEFLVPMGISMNTLGKAIDVPPGRISEICNGKRVITADTALRLGRYFGTTPELWMGLQSSYDLTVARLKVGEELEKIQPIRGKERTMI